MCFLFAILREINPCGWTNWAENWRYCWIICLNQICCYSECPKTERPETGKRRNSNFWQFRFQHVPISDIRDLRFSKKIGPKTKRLFGLLRLNCPKSEQKMSQIQTKSFGFRMCQKFERFCPICPFIVWISDARNCQKTVHFFGFRTLSQYWTVWNWAKSRLSEIWTNSDFWRWL